MLNPNIPVSSVALDQMLAKIGNKCYKADFFRLVEGYNPEEHIKSPIKSTWSFLGKNMPKLTYNYDIHSIVPLMLVPIFILTFLRPMIFSGL